MQPEIQTYLNDVAKKYDIGRHVRFKSVVESARWDETTGTWKITIRDVKTSEVMTVRSKVLISAVGALSIPKECDIPGTSDFEGRIFHTAKWDHSFDWKDKEVVIVGGFVQNPLASVTDWNRKRLQCNSGSPCHKLGRGCSEEGNTVRKTSALASRTSQPNLLDHF